MSILKLIKEKDKETILEETLEQEAPRVIKHYKEEIDVTLENLDIDIAQLEEMLAEKQAIKQRYLLLKVEIEK